MDCFNDELNDIRKKGLLRRTVTLEASRASRISISDNIFSNFASNDYLNLSGHPEIVRAAGAALKNYGLGSGASRLLSGTYGPHVNLEERIAGFKKTRAAVLFNTGYAANTGTIPVIAGKGAMIFSDELNHASIVDGAGLSRAGVSIFRHRDMNHLESLLKKGGSPQQRTLNRKLVITDTVFSMDGDIAPLRDMVGLCRKYGAILMIDDAHATGVIGKSGRGGLEHFNISSGNIIQMGTLSKAAGSLGGFVACKKQVADLLINRARSFIYSTSLPPAIAQASIMAIDILENKSGTLRERLWNNIKRLKQGVQELGFDTLGSETSIIPVLIGDTKMALHLGRHLYNKRIFAPAVRPPTVPEGKSRIRFSVTAAHTNDDIDNVIECLRIYKKKFQITRTK